MDTFVAAGLELSGHGVAPLTTNQPSKEQPIMFNNKGNLWVGVAKSRYINSAS